MQPSRRFIDLAAEPCFEWAAIENSGYAVRSPDNLILPPPTFEYLQLEPVKGGGKKDRAYLRFRPVEAMNNPRGVIQGGVIAAVLDDVTGIAMARISKSRPFTTAQLTTDFFRPCYAGECLIAEGFVVRHGRRQAVVDAILYPEDERDRILARGSAIQIYLDTSLEDPNMNIDGASRSPRKRR